MLTTDLNSRVLVRFRKLASASLLCLCLIICVLAGIQNVQAQLPPPPYSVIEGVDPVTLVQQVLIGQGVETFNITYTGSVEARGSFTGTSNLGILSGVILTSGTATNSVGPNNVGNKGTNNTASGDPDLNQLSGGSTQDAAVLEFDFIPQSNIVEFKYVFGSEEYPEYANSQYNDVFGFFISGPDIFGPFSNNARNIALVPQILPAAYVSINNINHLVNSQYYVNNSGGQYIQYDGFTTVLIARSNVVPCQTYHIKLAVADISDGAYDSGVFLQANSFSSVGLGANVAFSHAAVDTAVEACNNAELAFELFQITPVNYTIDLQIGGTAINGVDYELIPNQIIIPQGDTMVTLEIIPIDDNFLELTETVTIIYNSSLCGVTMDTLTIYIKDYPFYATSASPTPQTINCEDSITLYGRAYGGVEPYTYLWNTGQTTDSIKVSPASSTQYTVTITDECGSTEDKIIDVFVTGPVANITEGDAVNICLYDPITLHAEGGTSWAWMPDGQITQSITVSPLINTTYTVTVSDVCGNTDTDQILVTVGQPYADAGPDEDICVGQFVSLEANDTPNGTWVWTDMVTLQTHNGRTWDVSPPDSRQYCVDVTDNCGNTLTDCVFVNVFQLTADAGIDPTICAGDQITLTGSSSTGSGSFSWTDGSTNFSGQTIQVSPLVTTTYTLTVDDGCEASDAVTVNVNQLPAVSATASVGSICPDDQLTLNAGGAVNYTWSSDISDPSLTGQENSINPLVAPLANTTYTLTGTDANGCVNSDNVSVTVKERMFADFTLSQNAVCEGDPLIVTYSGNGNNSAIYNWNFDGGVSATTGQGPHTVSWTGNGTKTITLEVTQLACISAPFTQTVEVNAMPIADFTTGIAEGCVPITVSFTDNSLNTAAGVTYSWGFGTAGSQQGQTVNQEFTVAGKYNVQLTVTNPGGCINQKTKNAVVDAWPLPLAGFNANPESSSMKNPVIAFTSTSIGDNLTYEWNAGDGTTYNIPEFTHTYADSGYYRVELLVTNAYGCTDRFENQVFISPKYAIHIPGAFTPNGDGLNDVFQVHGNGVKEYSIWIYDRWGALVFFSNNIDQSWDGKIGGVPANRGIYVYHTYFKDENDEVSEKTGSINLLN
jgi:gliding motility-associated-like protein